MMEPTAAAAATGTVAEQLAQGGAYTAWFVVVVLAGVIVFLFREVKALNKELVQAYKEDDDDVLKNLASVIATQREQTQTLARVVGILEGWKR